jgi:hypothetical protein
MYINPKTKLGRPSKFSPAIAKVICDAITDGCPITHVATIAGVSFQWLCDQRKKHPEFDQQIREAFSHAIQARLAIVKKTMESKDESVALRAATWWLTHTPGAAQHFSESRRVELTGDGITTSVVVVLPSKDAESGARVIALDRRKELRNENGTND